MSEVDNMETFVKVQMGDSGNWRLGRGPGWKRAVLMGCLGWMALTGTSHAQLVVEFQGSTTISPSDPSIVLTVRNSSGSAVDIAGVNFFINVGGGSTGPTIDVNPPSQPTPGPGVDLLNGTLFQSFNFGQNSIGTVLPRDQGWGVALQSGHAFSLGGGASATLATITFNSFPVGGPYTLDFSNTTFAKPGGTFFDDVTLPNGDGVTVVPEPNAALGVGGALLLLAGLRRWLQNRTATNLG